MLSELYIDRIFIEKEKMAPDDYVLSLPVVRHLEELPLEKRVTFFVGENGTGKSTLLEAIAVQWGFNPEGGTINFHFSTNNTHSDLYRYLRLQKGWKRPRDGFFLRAESFYNVATNIEELDQISASSPRISDSYGGKSLHRQSHGESFLSLAMHRFGGKGLYLLDEPEAALSPTRQMTLLSRIHQLAEQDSQLIIATHSPILLAYPGADIYELTADGMKKTAYKQTEHYRVMVEFLNHPEQMLTYLLEDDSG